jgi:hypothetical protein
MLGNSGEEVFLNVCSERYGQSLYIYFFRRYKKCVTKFSISVPYIFKNEKGRKMRPGNYGYRNDRHKNLHKKIVNNKGRSLGEKNETSACQLLALILLHLTGLPTDLLHMGWEGGDKQD